MDRSRGPMRVPPASSRKGPARVPTVPRLGPGNQASNVPIRLPAGYPFQPAVLRLESVTPAMIDEALAAVARREGAVVSFGGELTIRLAPVPQAVISQSGLGEPQQEHLLCLL